MASEPTNDQLQGYDQSATMFTPEGRLRQVEYASKTAKRGSPAIGLVCTDGVVLLVFKRIYNALRIGRRGQKIIPVDDHVCVAISGIISDGILLAENAQELAIEHSIAYCSSVDVKTVVEDITGYLQRFTQFEGARPFGVSLIVTGVDETGPKLYVTETSGVFAGYRAAVIGEQEDEIRKLLQERYTADLNIRQGLALGIDLLHDVMKEKFDPALIEAVYIDTESRKMTYFDGQEIRKIADSL